MMKRGREGDGGKKERARERESCANAAAVRLTETRSGASQLKEKIRQTRRGEQKTKRNKKKIPAITAIMSQTVKTCAGTA